MMMIIIIIVKWRYRASILWVDMLLQLRLEKITENGTNLE